MRNIGKIIPRNPAAIPRIFFLYRPISNFANQPDTHFMATLSARLFLDLIFLTKSANHNDFTEIKILPSLSPHPNHTQVSNEWINETRNMALG